MNSRKVRQLKVQAKLDQLIGEYFPNGGYSVMDANRLKLAAAHYIDADLCRDGALNICWPNSRGRLLSCRLLASSWIACHD